MNFTECWSWQGGDVTNVANPSSFFIALLTFFLVLFILSGILLLELDHLKPPDRNGKKAPGLQRGLSVLLLHPSLSFSCLGSSCDPYRGSFIN